MKRGHAILASAALLLVAAGGFGYAMRGSIRDALYDARRPNLPPAVPVDEAIEPVNETSAEDALLPASPSQGEESPPPAPAPSEQPRVEGPPAIPTAYNLAVPWMVQAPFANWTGSYEDGCEEASALIVDHYYRKLTFPSQEYMKAELDKIFAWEDAHFGFNLSTTAEQTAEMIRGYFGYTNVVVTEEVTAARIKREVAAGRPVIVPAYGKALNNPNFKNGGPVYHMLVVKGYTVETFITNDPGTRRGADYVYPIATILNAAHDWNGGDVPNGRKVMIVVHPR